MAGIYIHIPFCKQACHYCDFHFSTSLALRQPMVDAICQELELRKAFFNGDSISTIYFGGGTPSLLEAADLGKILSTIRSHFQVNDSVEITLEANPDDISLAAAKTWRSLGINRLSVGIQSFDNGVLQALNRAHDASTAVASIDNARKAGFQNISIDLIYAIPGQSHEKWLQNIELGLRLNPEHISSYSLTIEPRTVFGRRYEKGEMQITPDDDAADQLESLASILKSSGYHQYEVSNFGKPGFYSQHNSSYWKREKYLGVGPSAHSFDGRIRQWNIRNNSLYIKGINSGVLPCETETLELKDQINDYLMTSLRTEWGIDLAFIKNSFGYDVLQLYRDYIIRLVDDGHALINDESLILTQKGKLLADRIASDLFKVE